MTTNGAVKVTALDEVLPLGAVPLALARPAVRAALTAQGAAAGGRDLVGRRPVEGAEPDPLRRGRAAGLRDGRSLLVPPVPRARRVSRASGRIPRTEGLARPSRRSTIRLVADFDRIGERECGEVRLARPGDGPVNDAWTRAGERVTVALVVALSVTVALAVATLVLAYRGRGATQAR